jgi:hypothetical protein
VGNFLFGSWELSFVQGGNTYTVGESKAVVAQADGSHLIYDDPPNGLFPYVKRDLAGSEHPEDEDSAPLADADLLHEPALNATITGHNDFPLLVNNLRRRAALSGTSFLNPRVYTDVLSCELAADLDACSDCDPQPDGSGSGSGSNPQLEPPTDSANYPATYQIYMRPKRVFSQTDECDYEWIGFEAYGLTTPEDGGTPCYPDGAWSEQYCPSSSTLDPDLPPSIDGIEVWGDTCTYTATADWRSVENMYPAGNLTCQNKWREASCIKGPRGVQWDCELGIAFYMVACSWEQIS